ncbi:MAG: hypothetical protein U5K51_09945 [Flavobacteriaceae bacterium]|nr:hypothetical protein [Flavobacteriaceae bacterium]
MRAAGSLLVKWIMMYFLFCVKKGIVTVDNDKINIKTGECIVVPHQAESRSIYA